MKKLITTALLLVTICSFSQVKNVSLQAAGLTCSMCSNAVYKSLSKVPFVKEVKSDIKNSTYNLEFKEGQSVDFDALKKAITDAGFSVALLKADIDFNNVIVENDAHVNLGGKTFHFLNVAKQTLNGIKTVTIVDKNFVTNTAYKKFSKFTTMKCYETGVMESCCKKDHVATRIYHVTI